MHRLRFPLTLVMTLPFVACGEDDPVGASADGSASNSGSGSADSTGASSETLDGTGTGGFMTDSKGGSGASSDTESGSGSQSDTDSTSGTTGKVSESNTATDSGSGSDSDTDSTGTGGDPPDDPPGVDTGPCMPPGATKYCYSGAPATYLVGECGPGMQECIAIDLDIGEWGPCMDDTTPEMEVCDSFDNDCDGAADEDLGTSNCGLNSCNHDEPNCIMGVENECDPFFGAMFETCDGEDNDCDGDIDEGLGLQVVTCGEGVCEHSVSACEDAPPPACDPFDGMMMEVCDGLDNDCDGDVDEDLGTTTCGVGQCLHTIDNCINGFPQMCDPFEGASMEVCDGIDNDCDGDTDEDQGTWTCGAFDCVVTIPACDVDGNPVPQSDCMPLPGGPEICGNGQDDNCDGIDPPCAETFLVGTDTTTRPIDVIWAIDTSGSMAAEIAAVEAELNNFANTLNAAGGSNSLHLIADRGTESLEMCVAAPLGGAGCTDNPGNQFWQYDFNGGCASCFDRFVHSSNALGRTMQQEFRWGPRLQAGSHIAFVVTTDDDGDDVDWTGANDPEPLDDCQGGSGFIIDTTVGNVCRWDGGNGAADPNYTSLANDFVDLSGDPFGGFLSFMTDFYGGHTIVDDWTYHAIIGNTGTTVLTGGDDMYEFNTCTTSVEDGDEYVKLALATGTHSTTMDSICNNFDLSALAQGILAGIPNDTYLLDGNPPGNCGQIDPATIVVVVNGIPLMPADWNYDGLSCTLVITNNVPVVGDNVVITYQNF